MLPTRSERGAAPVVRGSVGNGQKAMMPPTVGLVEKVRNYVVETQVLNGSKVKLISIALLRLLKDKFPSKRRMFDSLLRGKVDERLIIKNAIGTFSVLPVDDSIGKAMPHFEQKCHHWLEADRRNLFVDIGANIGFYTILATGRYGYERAVSFEPNPEVFKRLEQNLELNNLQDKAMSFNIALGEKQQTLPFRRYVSHTGLSGFAESENDATGKDREEYEIVEIETVSFDEFATTHDIDVTAITFIKIDVEGFEYSVLKGMKQTLHLMGNVNLVIEINDKNKFRNQTIELLNEAGFVLRERIGINHLFVKRRRDLTEKADVFVGDV